MHLHIFCCIISYSAVCAQDVANNVFKIRLNRQLAHLHFFACMLAYFGFKQQTESVCCAMLSHLVD